VAAQALAANGAKVYITGRRKEVIENSASVHGSEKALGSSGGSIVPLVMDVTSKESISAIVEHITKEDGYLNVCVQIAFCS
jgi:NAD(P)-dependent dehydrogenase (short-subunit alcohol dehydrogenase family)